MNVEAKLEQGLQVLQKIPQQKASYVLQWTLVIYIAWALSQLTWLLFAPQPTNVAIPPVQMNQKSNGQSGNSVNINAVSRLNLFGDFNAEPVVQEQPEIAPVTTLNLKLTGVVASSDINLAAAIIESSGKQETYGIDEKITNTRAVVREIYADRVILEQGGRRETLMLEGQEYTTISSGPAKKKAPLKPSESKKHKLDKETSDTIEQFRDEFASNPGKLSEYIKVSPVREDGQLKGYRVRPGKNVKLFKAFGLKSGDIAVEIDGFDLTDISQAMQAMQMLRSATEATLLLQRGEEVIQIFFSLQ